MLSLFEEFVFNDDFLITLWLTGGAVVFSFFAGMITKNYSHVDRLWSVLPPVYVIVWGYGFYREEGTVPLLFLLPAVMVVLWGIRLTVNFARRGGYRFSLKNGFEGEDYRWSHLRKKINHPVLFEIFNLFFICSFQLGVIFLFTLPVYAVGRGALKHGDHIGPVAILLFFLHIFFLLMEFISDNQQYRFFEKRYRDKTDPRYQLGFNTFGLWKISRHPNYLCELSQWLIVFLYALNISVSYLPFGIGIALLILVFAGSIPVTESITLKKYPEYKRWQRVTDVLIPSVKLIGYQKSRKKFYDEIKS